MGFSDKNIVFDQPSNKIKDSILGLKVKCQLPTLEQLNNFIWYYNKFID